MGKIFNKGLSEDDQNEGLFKRLKNIENKIKNENKQELEPIKKEEQPDESKMNQPWLIKSQKKAFIAKQ